MWGMNIPNTENILSSCLVAMVCQRSGLGFCSCDPTKQYSALWYTQNKNPFHPQWCCVFLEAQLPLPLGRNILPVTGTAGMSNWGVEGQIQSCPPGLPGISGNSLEMVQIFVCLFVHSPYLLKLQNANEMCFYLQKIKHMGKGLCLSHTAKLISQSDSSAGESFTSSTPGRLNLGSKLESLGSHPCTCKALNPLFLPFICNLIGLTTLPCPTLPGAAGLVNGQKVLKILGCDFCLSQLFSE